jgi:hypothetical protein
MDGPGQPGASDGSDGAGPEGAAEGEPAGAGARSSGAGDADSPDEAVEGEFKEV